MLGRIRGQVTLHMLPLWNLEALHPFSDAGLVAPGRLTSNVSLQAGVGVIQVARPGLSNRRLLIRCLSGSAGFCQIYICSLQLGGPLLALLQKKGEDVCAAAQAVARRQ